MDLKTFKEIYQDKSVIFKINKLVETMERKGDSRVHRMEASLNRNTEVELYYSREVQAMDERAEWLYGEIIRELDPDGIMEG